MRAGIAPRTTTKIKTILAGTTGIVVGDTVYAAHSACSIVFATALVLLSQPSCPAAATQTANAPTRTAAQQGRRLTACTAGCTSLVSTSLTPASALSPKYQHMYVHSPISLVPLSITPLSLLPLCILLLQHTAPNSWFALPHHAPPCLQVLFSDQYFRPIQANILNSIRFTFEQI